MPVQNTFPVQCIYIHTNSHVLIPSFRSCARIFAPTAHRRRPDGGPTADRRRSDGAPTALRRRSDGAPTADRRRPDGAPTALRRSSDGGPTAARLRSDCAPTADRRIFRRRECPSRPPYSFHNQRATLHALRSRCTSRVRRWR